MFQSAHEMSLIYFDLDFIYLSKIDRHSASEYFWILPWVDWFFDKMNSSLDHSITNTFLSE